MEVLVIDIGGSHVKMRASGAAQPRRFDSSDDLTPQVLVQRVRDLTADWKYDAISIGYPGEVDAHGPRREPGNLGDGWVGFDFSRAFGKPVRILNDAALQALGGYDGGRMLFLGLGTGVGSALVTEHVVVPLELGCLPYCPDETLFDRIGSDGRKKYGHTAWAAAVARVTAMLKEALAADYVLLGGGNAKYVEPLPEGARRGGNEDAFTGGFRLWEEIVEPHDRRSSAAWRVVR